MSSKTMWVPNMLYYLYFMLLYKLGSALDIYNGTDGCKLVPDLHNSPFLLRPGTVFVLHPKVRLDFMAFFPNQIVEFACAGSNVMTKGRDTGSPFVNGTCMPTSTLSSDYTWKEITCKTASVSKLKERFENCGYRIIGTSLDINFEITKSRILKIYKICYSKSSNLPLYSYFHGRPRRSRRPFEIENPRLNEIFQDEGFDFSQETVEKFYDIEIQRITINKLLNYSDLSVDVIKGGENQYFTPAFLVSSNMYYYKPYRKSTFRYINSAPMWNQIRLGNWAMVERCIRDFIIRRNASLQIWSGVEDILQLPKYSTEKKEKNLEYAEIYLYPEEKQLPVPLFFWTVILHSFLQRGIALIVVNNPFQTIGVTYIRCKDISDGTMWLDWQTKRMRDYGYAYACSIEDFMSNFKNAPLVKSVGVLRNRDKYERSVTVES